MDFESVGGDALFLGDSEVSHFHRGFTQTTHNSAHVIILKYLFRLDFRFDLKKISSLGSSVTESPFRL